MLGHDVVSDGRESRRQLGIVPQELAIYEELQLFLPTGWAMDAMHRLISFEAGPSSVAPHLIGMTIALVLALWGTSRLFRYE